MPSLATAASSTSLHRQWKTWFAVTGYSRGAKPVIVAVQRSVQTAAVILPPVSWLLGLRVLQALAVPSSVSFGRTAPSVELRLVIEYCLGDSSQCPEDHHRGNGKILQLGHRLLPSWTVPYSPSTVSSVVW